ncbi:hypothetical protein HYH03_003623 [Edaphochlamys debaryana]|uniref:Ribonuclease n=1 Tax=Edaphochlamys debaryana TaxID=47281 RepID=A0A835YIN9_9CHLO|nr:hypothetical protein HYH03_003623 [Edaphochlamys debaryana]|eukprot:KAG2498364.1 hypothetical protein HYH03_003623 [Edaphochlamys debaryana]
MSSPLRHRAGRRSNRLRATAEEEPGVPSVGDAPAAAAKGRRGRAKAQPAPAVDAAMSDGKAEVEAPPAAEAEAADAPAPRSKRARKGAAKEVKGAGEDGEQAAGAEAEPQAEARAAGGSPFAKFACDGKQAEAEAAQAEAETAEEAKAARPKRARAPPKRAAGGGGAKAASGPNRDMENQLMGQGYKAVGGADEAGRGPLAGPVVAAVCVLPQPWAPPPGLHDSKQMDEQTREQVYAALTTDPRVKWAVCVIDHTEIDRINILQAALGAMRRSAEALRAQHGAEALDYLLVDGNRMPRDLPCPARTVVKGDATVTAIAAASVLAKVTRDRLMLELEAQYPGYGFGQHKGYGVPAHMEAVARLGPCPVHRRSFEPIKSMTGWSREAMLAEEAAARGEGAEEAGGAAALAGKGKAGAKPAAKAAKAKAQKGRGKAAEEDATTQEAKEEAQEEAKEEVVEEELPAPKRGHRAPAKRPAIGAEAAPVAEEASEAGTEAGKPKPGAAPPRKRRGAKQAAGEAEAGEPGEAAGEEVEAAGDAAPKARGRRAASKPRGGK